MSQKKIPSLLWLYIPLVTIVAQVVLELSYDPATLSGIMSENGPHEIIQAIYSAAAFLYALWLLPKIDWKNDRLIGTAVVVAALGSFYITGEELSWGQQIVHWSTPDAWAHINDQDETNLHNTSSWLDQKPRALLFIGIVISGLLIPFLQRYKPSWVPTKFTQLYPSNIVIPTAVGVLGPYLVEGIAHHFFHVKLFERVSEVQELYMYYYVLIYLLDLNNREISKA